MTQAHVPTLIVAAGESCDRINISCMRMKAKLSTTKLVYEYMRKVVHSSGDFHRIVAFSTKSTHLLGNDDDGGSENVA